MGGGGQAGLGQSSEGESRTVSSLTASLRAGPFQGPKGQEGCPWGGASYLLAREITLLVESASC